MYKVTKRDCPIFGIGPYVCEFICDTASDISTLPTSISEGTGGRTAYDNQKCASGSIANVAENGAESKQYMLNNQDVWCPYSVAAGSSDSVLEEAKAYTDAEITDLINGAPTTRDTLKEISDAMAENQTVVEALDAAIGSKANKTDIPTKTSELENDSGFLTEHPHINEKPGPTTITSLQFGDSFDSIEQIVTDGNGHIQEVHSQTLTLPNILIENSLDIHSSGLLTNKTITAALNEKADTTHTHSASDVGADSRGSAATALSEAKTYTDNAISDLINGAPTTRDTLKEISDLMDENTSVVEALDAAIGTKANKTDIPTKTSELENDSGFLTEHQDLSAYAKTADLSSAVSSINTTLDTKANKTEIPTKTSELENDSGFLTEHQDLSAYAKSADVNASLGNKADASHTHNTYASKELYSKTGINFGRKANTVNGYKSTAEGNNTTASGDNSHAEGFIATASGNYSHAEGNYTTASGADSHAEGYSTTASGADSHAEGIVTTASGEGSHAEGYSTTASCDNSHASGHFNADMVTGGTGRNTVGTAFVIGNGTSGTVKSNAFSVMFDGTVKAKSTITASTTADYAEFFEWLDENPDGEDRVGYFVTLDGDKIRIANSDDEYILGVVSGEPFVLGNGDCDTWNGMFLRDEFRRTIYEPAPKMEEILDDDGNPTGEYVEVEGEYEGTRPKLNPEYDHTKKYTSRFDRKEWAPIGMLGVLAVRHDGTAKVNGYVTITDGGIATACEKHMTNSYRVIKSNTDTVVEIIFR